MLGTGAGSGPTQLVFSTSVLSLFDLQESAATVNAFVLMTWSVVWEMVSASQLSLQYVGSYKIDILGDSIPG